MLRPLLLALIALAAGAPAQAASEGWSCRDALTFRWAAPGETAEPGLTRAGDPGTLAPPFLVDPKVRSVTPANDTVGPHIEIGFGPDAAAILAEQTRDHVGETMIIMLGRLVLASPRVMEGLGDGGVVALYMPLDAEPFDRLVATLRQKADGCPAGGG